MRLPDFYIIGAQKSGTASLSTLLAARHDVFLSSPREPMFFCRDDTRTHPYCLLENPSLFRRFYWAERRDELVREYSELFRDARHDQIAGEGSTTYLVARDAAERIANVTPHAKLVALLRNPIDRAYSAYYHHLKNLRVVHSFENQLKFEPLDILDTGNYLTHLRRFAACFPANQLLILPFEQFARETQACYARICEFLGLAPAPISEAHQKANEALVPRSMHVQFVINRVLRLLGGHFETSVLRPSPSEDSRNTIARSTEKVIRHLARINRDKKRYPPMNPSTRALLQDYFARSNRGLSAFAGCDFSRWWTDFPSL